MSVFTRERNVKESAMDHKKFLKALKDVWQPRHSLKAVILWLFIPIIIFFVVVIGLLSYFLAVGQIQNNAYLSIGDTVSQTQKYLDNRLTAIFEQIVALENDVDTLSLLKRLDSDRHGTIKPNDYIQTDRHLERIFSTYYSMLDSILVYFNEGQLILSKKDYMSARIIFEFSKWRSKFSGNRTEYYWHALHKNETFLPLDSNDRVVSIFKLYGDATTRVRGIILFNLKEDFFRGILQDAQISENGYLILFDQDGMMSFKDVPEEYEIDDKIKQALLNQNEPAGRLIMTNAKGRKMIVVYDTVPINRWKLAAVFPENDIINRAVFIKNITLAVVLLFIITAVILSNLLAKVVTTPLTILTEKVKEVKTGNLEVLFDVDPVNEIGILNGGIRELLGRVRHLLEQVRQEQEQKRLAELETLQAQIKPHFLYNTLDSIKQLCELGETKEAGAMVASLAKFFRISISNGQELITIAEEIEHIQNYLKILKMRYADGFEYQIVVQPELMPCQIIKLTLQPLVENAIYHGIKEKRGKGLIRVNGYLHENDVVIEVYDNGAGMSRSKLENLRDELLLGNKDQGIGIRNVHRRLRLHYGPAYGVEIKSVFGEGTWVWVRLPAKFGGVSNDSGHAR